jgi:type II secretory pathway pseudopilin PulG
MNAPLIHKRLGNAAGVTVIDLLIAVAMIGVITGFLLVNYFQGRRAIDRTKTAVEFANYLQKARLDSMRRSAKDIDEMAQVRVFNRRFYSVALDADGDGQLDIPLVMTLPAEQGVEINGPFPKTFIFDWLGQTVDAQNIHTTPEPINVSNSSGASTIKFTETGKVVVVSGAQSVATK